jgi:hypothetical protein
MKTISKMLLLALFLFIASAAIAQKYSQDVVYLKNGTVIRGDIIETDPGKLIKIETDEGNVFVFLMSEIDSIAKKPAYKIRTRPAVSNTGIAKGYYGAIEWGACGGFGITLQEYGPRLNIINGYRFNPWLAAGLGFGLRYYFNRDNIMLPFFADVRGYLLNKKKTPYMSLGIGYAFDPAETADGGFMLNPMIGYSVKLKERTAWNIAVGYELMCVSLPGFNRVYDNATGLVKYERCRKINPSHIFSLQFGVTF